MTNRTLLTTRLGGIITGPTTWMKQTMTDNTYIFVYSRAQAIADGVLVDVTETAREAGLKYPTALTAAVWAQYVTVPEGVIAQDEQGRLWDIIPSTRLCRMDGLFSHILGKVINVPSANSA